MKTPTLTETCPWCESPITHEKFIDIEQRIRAGEEARHRELSGQLRAELEERHRRELARQKEALEKELQGQAAKRMEAVLASKAELEEKLHLLEDEAELSRKRVLEEAAERQREELLKLREVLEKDRDDAVLKQ